MFPTAKNVITIQSDLNRIVNLVLNLFFNIPIFQQKILKQLEIAIISRTTTTTTRTRTTRIIRFNGGSSNKGFDLLKFVKNFIKKVEKVGDLKISKFSKLFLVSSIPSSDYRRIISLNLIKEDLSNYYRGN